MPREVPANMVAALAATHQTVRNNADPRITCDLTYSVSAFSSFGSFDKPEVALVQAPQYTGYHQIRTIAASQAVSHPVYGEGDVRRYTAYAVQGEDTVGVHITVEHLPTQTKSNYFKPLTETPGVTVVIYSVAIVFDGTVQTGAKGEEFVTSGNPYLIISYATNESSYTRVYAYRVNGANDIPRISTPLATDTFDNVSMWTSLHAVCPAVLGGSAPGIYVYFNDYKNKRIHAVRVQGTTVTNQATAATYAIDADANVDSTWFSAAAAPDGRVVIHFMQLIDDGDYRAQVTEHWSSDGLNFSAGTDITTLYTYLADPEAEPSWGDVQHPGWILFYSDRMQLISHGTVIMQSVSDDDYSDWSTARWSSWLPISGRRGDSDIYTIFISPSLDNTVYMVEMQKTGYSRFGPHGEPLEDSPIHVWGGYRGNTLRLGNATADGSITIRNDNGIAQLNLTIHNNDTPLAEATDSPLRPGTRVDVSLCMGTSDPMALIAARLDEANIDVANNTYTLSGRNLTGYHLSACSFYQKTTLSGTCDQIAAAIFLLAGISDYDAMVGGYSFSMTFDQNTTALDAIKKLCDYFTTGGYVFECVELATGKIVIGYRSWINANYQTLGYFDIYKGKCWKHNIRRSADAAYAMVCATGQDANGHDLNPTFADIQTDPSWQIPENKIYYASAPDKMTQLELQDYADNLAKSMGMAGVTETFVMSIQPQVLVGDVLRDAETQEVIGIITSVKHKFGAGGFSTELTTDTGGLIEEEEEPDPGEPQQVVTKTRNIDYNTCKQQVSDVMTSIAKNVAKNIAIGLLRP